MNPPPITLRGMDTPEHLLAWFKAKGMTAIVFNVADLRRLPLERQRQFIDFYRLIYPETPETDVVMHLPTVEFRMMTYVVIKPDDICSALSMDDLEKFQALVYEYMEDRRSRGVTLEQDYCECKIKGTPSNHCKICNGSQTINVINEVTWNEAELSSNYPHIGE